MKRVSWKVFLLSGASLLASAPFAQAELRAEGACTPKERWDFGSGTNGAEPSPQLSEDRRADFTSLLEQKSPAVQGFAEGMALRMTAQSPTTKALGEYWAARALHEGGLSHLAFDGFVTIAAREPSEGSGGVQLAALECLLNISARYPSMALPEKVSARLGALQRLAKTPSAKEVVWRGAGALLRQQLGKEKPDLRALDGTLSLFSGGGHHETFHKGLAAASRRDHNHVISQLGSFLEEGEAPAPLARFKDPARLLLARSLYTLKQFDRASHYLKQVSRASNELASSLSELSWAFLLNERYPEAIGTSMGLSAGGLRHTFAPEAGMVAAMALNELCQYPESVRAIAQLRKKYERPYKWLSQWAGNRGQSLYPLAVRYLRKQGDVPDKVASEWVRSPLLISSQEELNLLVDEKEAASRLGRSGTQEQRRLAERIIQIAHELKPRYQVAKMRLKSGEELPLRIRQDLKGLKREITRFRRLQHAAPVWRTALSHSVGKAPGIQASLIAGINDDLNRRSERMFQQLDEIAENLQLIEIEIYNGASQDIIWQNAHPDYKEVAKKLNDETTASAEKVWNWGRAPALADGENGEGETGEIWEDELGSFKANLFDNCRNKDKYLALRLRKKK